MGDEITPIRKQEVLMEVGGPVDESSATLAIYGDDLDPTTVSNILGCSPSHSHRKGDRKTQTSPPFRSGAWLLRVEVVAPKGPEDAIATLLRGFPQEEQFWRRVVGQYQAIVKVGIHTAGWNQGFSLSTNTMSMLVRCGLELEVDFYLYGDESGGGV